MGVMKKQKNKLENGNSYYELWNPINDRRVEIYELKEDRTVNYGNNNKTKLITAKVKGNVDETDSESEVSLVCFEIPEKMNKEDLYKNGVLNVLTYNGAFYSLKGKEYNHVGRISEFVENSQAGYGYAIEPATNIVLNYVKRSLNHNIAGKGEEIHSIPSGVTKEGLKREIQKGNFIKITGNNSYVIEDIYGKEIKLENVNIASNIKHSDGSHSTLYTCKRVVNNGLGKQNVSFELPTNIGNIVRNGNEDQIGKLRELVSDPSVANFTANNAKPGTNKNLTYIGNLQYTEEGYQITDGASPVLGYVDEIAKQPRF